MARDAQIAFLIGSISLWAGTGPAGGKVFGGDSHAENADRDHAQVEKPLFFTEGALGVQQAEGQRSREGTRIQRQIGWFKTAGDRLTFQAQASGAKYIGLENLALERIAKVVSDRHDHPQQLLWEVSGTLTEYRGVNYVLISHAVLKSKQQRGLPGVARNGK
jgi:hypothetical protein